MKIDLHQIITASKLQPKIFKITKNFAKDQDGRFLAIVDRNNEVLCYMVSPFLFESLQKDEQDKKAYIEKMKKDYQSYAMEVEDEELERASLNDYFQESSSEISSDEEEYYKNLLSD